MTTLVWDAIDERLYELGVDRGVLQIPGNPVLPWNGLVSISEEEVNDTEMHAQFDGVTYADFKLGGFYQSKVRAYGLPNAFYAVLGLTEAIPGLLLTGQPRAMFNLSYRTMIGETDYKIHFVHNATVSPVNRSRSTISDKAKAELFDWVINAVPPNSTIFRPHAHMVVTTTKTDPLILVELENLLYGTVGDDPYFPTQQEIIDLFTG